MKKKRFKISFLSFLAIVLVLVISTGLEKSSLAAKNKGKRDSLINGVNEISNETLTLRQSRIERFEKLEKDYKENTDEFKMIVNILFDQAKLIEGLEIDNPLEYAKNIWKLI